MQPMVCGVPQPNRQPLHCCGLAIANLSPASRVTTTISAAPVVRQPFSILASQIIVTSCE
jgi:hypothetical protein